MSIIMSGPPPLKLIQLEQGLRIIFTNDVVLFIPSRSVSLCLVSHSWSVLGATPPHLRVLPRSTAVLTSSHYFNHIGKKSPAISPKLCIIIHYQSFLWQNAHNPLDTSAKSTVWKSIVFIDWVLMKWRLQGSLIPDKSGWCWPRAGACGPPLNPDCWL